MSIELLEGKEDTQTGVRPGLQAPEPLLWCWPEVESGTHREGLRANGGIPEEAGREEGKGSWRRERTGLERAQGLEKRVGQQESS